jgi:outer membrane immunogenic protein
LPLREFGDIFLPAAGEGSMKHRLTAILAAAFIAGAGQAAFAADMPVKAPAYKAAAPVAFNWSGFYVGGNVGYGWGKANSDVTLTVLGFPVPIPDTAKPKGTIGGAQIGYNWQLSPNWVLGVEADWQASGQKASIALPDQPFGGIICLCVGTLTSAYDAKIDWFGTVRGRVGYGWDRFLIFATGGLAYGEVKIAGTATESGVSIGGPFSSTASFGGSKVNAGWTLGGGVEAALVDGWSVKAEYLYLDLGSLDTASAGPFGSETVTTHTRFTDNIVRVGVNYRFWTGR